MKTKFLSPILMGCAAVALQAGIARAELPSGERQLGETVIEPAYDLRTGELTYIMTPQRGPSPPKADAGTQAPLYLVVYPNAVAGYVGTMNCAHEGGDNCPDHGPTIASIAQSTVPAVYGNGVWGHDHVLDGAGGSDFSVTWHAVVVLFTNLAAAATHVTTAAQLDAAIDAGDAMTIEIPVVLHGNLVSGATYARGEPVAD
jgi:hypothetical protein